MRPSGRRTATAQFDGPRIITPSRTACPPTLLTGRPLSKTSRARALRAAAGGLGLPPPEPLDAAAGVDQLLLARVERVAVRADLDVDLALGRPRGEVVPARAV